MTIRLNSRQPARPFGALLPLLLLGVLVAMPGQAAPSNVVISEANGVQLQSKLYLPASVTAPAIVALHGCGGPLPRRDDGWAELLAKQGHAVLLPDSFASRGLQPECKQSTHGADAYGPRRDDALAAATWLAAQKFAPAGGVLLLGWSDGGTTVLATIDNPPPHLFRGAIAFYPACTRTVKNTAWRPGVPLLVLMGAADDWTPPAPCITLAQRVLNLKLVLFPNAYHDFDVPDDPVHELTGLPYTANGNGTAHAGENPAARASAQAMVPAFYASLPPG